ncbi:hypothetical protein DFJ74DRAFT_768271 [Hyaloraphidium curvatum]|nr:hypothetical protein DFJ74DRAFT_768271 [Hyaloraphidium curvatum]
MANASSSASATFLRVKRKRDDEPLDVLIVDRKRTKGADDAPLDDSNASNATPAAAPASLVFALAHAALPARHAAADLERLIRARIAAGTPAVADFFAGPEDDGVPGNISKFAEAREERVRGYERRSRSTRFRVVSVNRSQGTGDGPASAADYELYEALAEEEAIRVSASRRTRRTRNRPGAPPPLKARTAAASDDAEAEARMAALMPMLREYLRMTGGDLGPDPEPASTPASPAPWLPRVANPDDDFVYDLYMVADGDMPAHDAVEGPEGDGAADSPEPAGFLTRLRQDLSAGELVMMDEDELDKLIAEEEDDDSVDEEDSNAEEYYTHDYPDEDEGDEENAAGGYRDPWQSGSGSSDAYSTRTDSGDEY